MKSNPHERYVITGTGAIAGNVENAHQLRELLLANKSILKPHYTEDFGHYLTGLIDYDRYKDRFKKRESKRNFLARTVVEEAINHAGLKTEDFYEKDDYLIVNGSDGDDRHLFNIAIKAILKREDIIKNLPEGFLYSSLSNSPSGYIGALLKTKSPCFMVSGACASSNLALQQTMINMKAQNKTRAIVFGVSNEAEGSTTLWGFKSLRIMTPAQNLEEFTPPLDENRMGTVLADGSGAMIIERLDTALERGAKILAELGAVSFINTPESPILSAPHSIKQAIKQSLILEGISIDQIDLINLHATGTFQGDINEIAALKSILKEKSSPTYINSSKGHLGHLLGTCGLVEIIGNIPSFEDQLIHSIYPVKNLDPECNIDGLVLDSQKVSKPLNYLMNINLGMSGVCSVSLLRKWNGS